MNNKRQVRILGDFYLLFKNGFLQFFFIRTVMIVKPDFAFGYTFFAFESLKKSGYNTVIELFAVGRVNTGSKVNIACIFGYGAAIFA